MEMSRRVDYSKLELAIYRQFLCRVTLLCVARHFFARTMFALLIGLLTVLGPPIRTIEVIKAFFMK